LGCQRKAWKEDCNFYKFSVTNQTFLMVWPNICPWWYQSLIINYSVTRCKKKADLSDKNKTIESQSSEHTRAKLRQYLNDISKKKEILSLAPALHTWFKFFYKYSENKQRRHLWLVVYWSVFIIFLLYTHHMGLETILVQSECVCFPSKRPDR
jgi:hypothetical protein